MLACNKTAPHRTACRLETLVATRDRRHPPVWYRVCGPPAQRTAAAAAVAVSPAPPGAAASARCGGTLRPDPCGKAPVRAVVGGFGWAHAAADFHTRAAGALSAGHGAPLIGGGGTAQRFPAVFRGGGPARPVRGSAPPPDTGRSRRSRGMLAMPTRGSPAREGRGAVRIEGWRYRCHLCYPVVGATGCAGQSPATRLPRGVIECMSNRDWSGSARCAS